MIEQLGFVCNVAILHSECQELVGPWPPCRARGKLLLRSDERAGLNIHIARHRRATSDADHGEIERGTLLAGLAFRVR